MGGDDDLEYAADMLADEDWCDRHDRHGQEWFDDEETNLEWVENLDFDAFWRAVKRRPYSERAADALTRFFRYRWPAFCFWRLISAHWASFYSIPAWRYEKAFRRHKSSWSAEEILSGADKEFFDALPATFLVYRGQDAKRRGFGLSWTRSRETAELFALQSPYKIFAGNDKPTIIMATVEKKDVAFVEDSEAEVVLFERGAAREIKRWRLAPEERRPLFRPVELSAAELRLLGHG